MIKISILKFIFIPKLYKFKKEKIFIIHENSKFIK